MSREYIVILIFLVLLCVIFYAVYKLIQRQSDENYTAELMLSEFINKSLSPSELGLQYERYIGYLFEREGKEVIYHGALKGFDDLGRDLIIKDKDNICIVQAKCWAKYKYISENHIFQLYGSTEHFKKTNSKSSNMKITPIFYTSAKYSDMARDVAKILGVRLISKSLERTYPMVKCITRGDNDKIYFIPTDPMYDNILMTKNDYFVHTVEEAVKHGFLWSDGKKV